MREIKFRAWDEADGYHRDEGCMTYNADHKCDADAIMQFTGLSDKNGNDIYEGDILDGYQYSPNEYHQVVFKADRYSCAFVAVNNRDSSHINIWYEGLKVIGNIYENKELLNER